MTYDLYTLTTTSYALINSRKKFGDNIYKSLASLTTHEPSGIYYRESVGSLSVSLGTRSAEGTG